MPNCTVPAADAAWTKINDVTANLNGVRDLIAAAMIVCDNSSSREGDYAYSVLSAASNQIATAVAELGKLLKAVPEAAAVATRTAEEQADALNTQDTLSEAATLVEGVWMAATALQRDQANTIQTIAAAAKAKIIEAASDLAKFNPARGRAA